MKNLSIIIPAYNEAERISTTLFSIQHYLERTHYTYEILVVDDGSTDNTVELVNNLRSQIESLRVLPLKTNMGKGQAVRVGMLSATGKIRVFTDADGSTPIEELEPLILPLKNKESLISIGSRYHENSKVLLPQPRYRVIWSRFANKIVQRFLLPGVVDPNCGFKAFDGSTADLIFSKCTVNQWSFDLEVLAIAKKLSIQISEVPIKWRNDDRSKGKISHVPREIINLLRIRKKVKGLRYSYF